MNSQSTEKTSVPLKTQIAWGIGGWADNYTFTVVNMLFLFLYVDYFEMRSFQCETLHLLHYKIRKIRTMPDEAKELADFIEYLIPHLRETNDPSAQLLVLRDLLEAQKKHALPQTRNEFENRAILYHVLCDLEDFLLRKKQFVDRLDHEQKILHWQNKG